MYRYGRLREYLAIVLMLIYPQTDDSNLFRWKLGLWVVNPDSVWHGAYLRVSHFISSESRQTETDNIVRPR